jgi:DNA excision repair protein ERCC-2
VNHPLPPPLHAPEEGDSTWVVAVRSLCQFAARQGDLDLRFTPSPTGVEGIAGHQSVTARRPASYQRERALSARCGPLTVQGRADGFDAVALRVEEIKTHRGAADHIPDNHRALHWAQVEVYGWMLCEQLDLPAIELALTYYHMETGEETVHLRHREASALRAGFEALCATYIAWSRNEQAHRRARDAALSALSFPFAAFRRGQRDLAAAVYRAHTQGRHLLAQAPTGIGKTMATLFASLRAAPAQGTDRLFYLTARTTGRQLALDALQRLGAPDRLPLRVLERLSLDKACEHPDKDCHGASCPLATGFYDRLPAARTAAAQAGWLDKAALRALALEHQVCPYHLGQEMQRWCDVLVGDYNHQFDQGAHWHALTQEHGWRVALLVDEAHHLIERARQMYSASLDGDAFLRLRTQAPASLKKPLDALNRQWRALARAHPGAHVPLGAPPAAWLNTLRNAAAAVSEQMALGTAPDADGTWQNWAFEALGFLRLSERFDTHSLCDLERRRDADRRALPSIHLRNLVPGPLLAERWSAAHSATLFSATLSPMGHVTDMLGLPQDTQQLALPSPFDPAQLDVRIAPWISTRFRDRNDSLDDLVQVIVRQYLERPGNYLAFFSSFDYLLLAHARFRAVHPSLPVWAQSRGMSETDRDAFVSRFTAGGCGIGFAVLGGAFGEGIDLPGDRLVGAFIATLGMPQVNAVNEQMRAHLETRCGQGHGHTYLFPGLMKVVQAAGRVIRSEQDRGCVWLLDDRFARADIRRLLPTWWRVTIACPPREQVGSAAAPAA